MSNLAEVIQMTESRFNEIAPAWMKYGSEKGFAIQLVKGSQQLKQASHDSPESLQQAITNVAAIGLSLNPAEKLAYLISRNVKVKDENGGEKWIGKIFLEPSYMGLCRLATDSGSIEWIQADVVRENDTFIYNGPGKETTFEIAGKNAFTADRGGVVGVFCTAKTLKGDYLTNMMSLEEITAVRDRSDGWKAYQAKRIKSTPWATDFNEMAKKTAVRQGFKMWPRTDERRMERMSMAVHLSNENEGFEPIISSPGYGQYTADQKGFFDQLIESGDALGMYVFMESFGHDASSNDASVMVSLYHSFPHGEKGKYRRIVDGLRESGKAIFEDYLTGLQASIVNEDESGIREIIAELEADVVQALAARLTPEEAHYFESLNVKQS